MTTIRTSENSPLYINEMPCGGGTIGMTICPGKKGSSFYGAPWRRDLTIDLPVVLDWGPSAVVSILEPHELELLEVPVECGPPAVAVPTRRVECV